MGLFKVTHTCSFVILQRMDSLTLITCVKKKLLESIRPNHHLPSSTCKTGSWPRFLSFNRNMLPWWCCKNGFPDFENVGNDKTIKIHKIQSSVPSGFCKTGSWPRFPRSLEHAIRWCRKWFSQPRKQREWQNYENPQDPIISILKHL